MSNATDHVGFVTNPNNGRGTISLLLECLSTIFLCVYTSIHLDVPSRRYPLWKRTTRKCVWVATAVIFPELLTFLAFGDWLGARYISQRATYELGTTISKKQAHYILSGGMRISRKGDNRQSRVRQYIENSGCFSLEKVGEHRCREFWTFIIKYLPSDYELDQLSNASAFGKIITCLQAGKTLVLIVGRAINKIDVSLIEITTGAYITMALLSYFFWWNKPYDMQTYQIVTPPFEVPDVDDRGEAYKKTAVSNSGQEVFWRDIPKWANEECRDTNDMSWKDRFAVCFVYASFASLFGLIHCTAWNYIFPTATESLLWRIFSITITSIPWVDFVCDMLGYRDWWPGSRRLGDVSAFFFCLLYGSGRLFLLLEMFISLRSAPRGIYQQPDWTTYLGRDGA